MIKLKDILTEAMSDAEIKKMHQKYKDTGELPAHLKKMLKGKSYSMLLNHSEHQVIEIYLSDDIATYEVTVIDAEKKLPSDEEVNIKTGEKLLQEKINKSEVKKDNEKIVKKSSYSKKKKVKKSHY